MEQIARGVSSLNVSEDPVPVHTAVLSASSATQSVFELLQCWSDELNVGIRVFWRASDIEDDFRDLFILVGGVGQGVGQLVERSNQLSSGAVHTVIRSWWYAMRDHSEGGGCAPQTTPSHHKLQRPHSFGAAPYSSNEDLAAQVHQLGLKALDWDTVMFNSRLMHSLGEMKQRSSQARSTKKPLSKAISKPDRKKKETKRPPKKGAWSGSCGEA